MENQKKVFCEDFQNFGKKKYQPPLGHLAISMFGKSTSYDPSLKICVKLDKNFIFRIFKKV